MFAFKGGEGGIISFSLMRPCEDLDVSDVDLLHFYLNDFVLFQRNDGL